MVVGGFITIVSMWFDVLFERMIVERSYKETMRVVKSCAKQEKN
jgi:hypothetical protein